MRWYRNPNHGNAEPSQHGGNPRRERSASLTDRQTVATTTAEQDRFERGFRCRRGRATLSRSAVRRRTCQRGDGVTLCVRAGETAGHRADRAG